jgi:hypothetical protein
LPPSPLSSSRPSSPSISWDLLGLGTPLYFKDTSRLSTLLEKWKEWREHELFQSPFRILAVSPRTPVVF